VILAARRKAHTTLRLDADMFNWFHAQGRGHQTRVNAIPEAVFRAACEVKEGGDKPLTTGYSSSTKREQTW
jgi:hypothetical protein